MDESYMRIALATAERARQAGELPFGAILVGPEGEVLRDEHDRVAERGDPTQHAEVRLVAAGCADAGGTLQGHTVYTTCEPCAMCFTSMWLAGVSRVVYGTTIAAVRERSGGRHQEMPVNAAFLDAASGGLMALTEGVLADDCLFAFGEADFSRVYGERRAPAR